MLLHLHNENPNIRDVKKIIEIIDKDGVIILPTDTIYAMGCRLDSKKGIEQMCRVAGKKPEKVNFSLLCADLSHLSEYTAPLNKNVFRLMKNNLPGPFTFILDANKNVTKWFTGNKKTIGIRVPNNIIAQTIIEQCGVPLVVTTIHHEDEILEYMTDPVEIHDKFENQVALVIDGGPGAYIHSTIIDCTAEEPILIRQGKGIINE
ncbi:MAG: L-threonylcarbamoyladenylate synthase [Bacteroidota bacterium]|jgi:tRNA threonylcarbamoyl adenosine modification protein (Sua5/YciO/YrdC/YwlC family)